MVPSASAGLVEANVDVEPACVDMTNTSAYVTPSACMETVNDGKDWVLHLLSP